MAKRFIDTEIWDKDKFCSATDKQKLLTLFITSKCDQVGVFKMANMIVNAYIGSPVTKEDILSIPVDIEELSDGKYWLINFCRFQYGELKETCKPHKKYIEMLKSEGLFERVSKGYPKGIHTLQEKEEEKEEDKEEEKEPYKMPDDKYAKACKWFFDELLKRGKIKKSQNWQTKAWYDSFRLLEQSDGIDWTKEFTPVIKYYVESIGKEYCPEAYSPKAVRTKWIKLQGYKDRNENNTSSKSENAFDALLKKG